MPTSCCSIPATVIDRATPQEPHLTSVGIERVWVNGVRGVRRRKDDRSQTGQGDQARDSMSVRRHAVVTGVSTGIGYAIARTLIDHDVRVFGSVRRVEDGARLRAELGERFTPLVFDVTDAAAIHAAVPAVAESLEGGTLFGLVNNAGIAIGGPLIHQPLDQVRLHLEVNTLGVLAASQAFAPLLGLDRRRTGNPGRIINISSVAGRISAPFLGAYAALKRALEGLSHSLRRELMTDWH